MQKGKSAREAESETVYVVLPHYQNMLKAFAAIDNFNLRMFFRTLMGRIDAGEQFSAEMIAFAITCATAEIPSPIRQLAVSRTPQVIDVLVSGDEQAAQEVRKHLTRLLPTMFPHLKAQAVQTS